MPLVARRPLCPAAKLGISASQCQRLGNCSAKVNQFRVGESLPCWKGFDGPSWGVNSDEVATSFSFCAAALTWRYILIVAWTKDLQRGNHHRIERLQPNVMKTKPFSLFLLLFITGLNFAFTQRGFGQDQPRKEAKSPNPAKKTEDAAKPAAPEQKPLPAEPAERFKVLFTKAYLSGRWASLKDGALGEEKTGDKYNIVSVAKGSGDNWTVNAKLKYRDQEVVMPIPVQMRFVGDVAILEVNNLAIPNGGTYTARLLIYERTYSGTWKSERGGGMLYGTITNDAE